MNDDVETELERPLQRRRSERVVGDGQDSSLPADARDSGEIRDAKQRIAGRLDPDHFGRRRDRSCNSRRIAGLPLAAREPRAALTPAMKKPLGPAVKII